MRNESKILRGYNTVERFTGESMRNLSPRNENVYRHRMFVESTLDVGKPPN